MTLPQNFSNTKNIHSFSLSSFMYTPCLCPIQLRWYNNSLIQTLLRFYAESSIAQHTFTRFDHIIFCYNPHALANCFFRICTLPHSLISLHNFSYESATCAVSSSNRSWFTSRLLFAHSWSSPRPSTYHLHLAPVA